MKGRVVDPGYLAKRKPLRLDCEVCGINKDCVPCGNHRWCKRGRCPICFPTILHLEQSGKVASAEQQMQVQRKIWDMEFWCETCNQFGRKAPILKDKLDLPDGQHAVPLDLFPGFYMTRDGNLLNGAEYSRFTQQGQPGAAAAAAAQQQQLQHPASAQQQPRPAAAPAQQQTQKASPAAAAAAAGGGGPAVKDKRASEGGEPAKKRLKMSAPAAVAGAGARPAAAQQQQQKGKAAAAATAGSSDSDDSGTSSADEEPSQPKQKAAAASPGKKPAAVKAPARPAAAAAAAVAGGNAAPATAKGPRPPDGQAAGGGSKAGAGAARSGQPPSQAASKQRGAEPPAASPSNKPPGATPASAAAAAAGKSAGAAAAAGGKEAASKLQNRSPSPLSAAAARILQRRSPEGGSSREGTSSDGVPLRDLPSHVQAKKAPAAAGAGAQASRLKPAGPGQQQQQQQQQRAGLASKASADAAGKRPAVSAAAAAPAAPAGKAKPAPQQQQQRPGLAPKPSGDAASKQQREQQQARPAGKLAQAAAARVPGTAAAGKQDTLRKQQQQQQQDRAGAGKSRQQQQQQQQRKAAAVHTSSEEESDESGSAVDSSEDGSIDKDMEAAIFGSDEAQADRQQQAAKGPQAAAGSKQQGGPLANGRPAAAAAAAAAAAEAEASKPQPPRRKAFSLLDYMKDGAAAAADACEQAAGQADGRAAAAAQGAGLRQREAPAATPRASSALWPVKCKVEAAGPNFRYEFVARLKEAPSRSGVAVPPQLERQREGTLRCMFWTRETMLSCVQADSGSSGGSGGAGAGLQSEPIFDEPAPVVLTEFALLAQHTAHLPSIVRFMAQHKSYMRVWTNSGSLFFGVLLRENGHVADFGSANMQRVRPEHLPDLLVSNELGLVMFKDAREEATPAAYGKLLPDLEPQVTPRTPTWRAAVGASSYDDSWLYDTNLDNFYEQEVIDTVIAQGAHAMNAMNAPDMNMDDMKMDWQPSPVWQQQWQALSAGMRRELLAPAAAAAAGGGGSTTGQQQQRPRMPSRMSRAPPPGSVDNAAAAAGGASIPSPAFTVTPPDAADPGSDQQQQGDPMEEDTGVAGGGQSAAAAAAGGSGQPAQPVQHVDEQQLVGLSPLQRLLRGGRPLWPLVPTAEAVLDVLRTKGLKGLVVYLEEGSFHDYLGNTTTAGQSTRDYVKRARQMGVSVYAPADPPETPAPGTVHVVMVTKAQMEKCGIEVSIKSGGIMEYLVSGALVVAEQFIVDLVALPAGSREQLVEALADKKTAMPRHLKDSFFRTGIFLLLDLSLLLTADMAELHALLLQLDGLRSLMPARDPKAKPQVHAYCTQENLTQVAVQKWGDEAKWHAVYEELTQRRTHLCGLLDPRYISSKREPASTHMLRNAHKVTFNFNNPKQFVDQHDAPLRFTVVVAADPAAAGLSAEQRVAAHQLLDNGDGQHKTVIAATLQQTRHLLAVLREQLGGG